MRTLRLLVLLLIGLSAEAGIFYRVHKNGETGRVWIDGDKRRIEWDLDPATPRASDITIIANGKTTYINTQNNTYFYEGETPGVRTTVSNFRLPWPVDSVKGQPKVTYRKDGAGPALGDHATTRHTIQFRYRLRARMHDVSLLGDVDATLTMLAIDALPRFDAEPPATTGLPEVDDALRKHFASMKGLVVGYELTVNRKLEGGPVITERISQSADELKTIDVDPKLFEVPAGYTHQAPVFGIPGT